MLNKEIINEAIEKGQIAKREADALCSMQSSMINFESATVPTCIEIEKSSGGNLRIPIDDIVKLTGKPLEGLILRFLSVDVTGNEELVKEIGNSITKALETSTTQMLSYTINDMNDRIEFKVIM